MIGPPSSAGTLAPEGVASRTGTPTPPPPPQPEGGAGFVASPMSALDRALSGPRRMPEPSRHRPRSEEGTTGRAPTKAGTIAPSVTWTPGRDAVMCEASHPPLERWEGVRRLTRYYSVHCGNCHGLLPLGSHGCGFCRYQFLPTRVPIRRERLFAPSGLDRDMNRSPSRNRVEPKRGHTRSHTHEARA